MGKYFNDCKNPAELDARHLEIQRVFSLDSMDQGNLFKVEVEAEYNALKESFGRINGNSYSTKETLTLEEIIQRISFLNLQGEVCGSWLWLTGNETHAHRETLKGLGFRYSPSKRSWYWRAYANRSSNTSPVPLDAIREKYGSAQVQASI